MKIIEYPNRLFLEYIRLKITELYCIIFGNKTYMNMKILYFYLHESNQRHGGGGGGV